MSTATAELPVVTSIDAATGERGAEFPIADSNAVTGAVARARAAGIGWQQLGFDGRQLALDRWRRQLFRDLDELAALVRTETGKSLSDARLEIGLALEHLKWAAHAAASVLGGRRRKPGLLARNERLVVSREPYGVVGVIGPWNWPVYTPMGAITGALAAGNSVVYKSSPVTPRVAHRLVETFAAATGLPDVFQVVQGHAETGTALCRSGVDKVAFIGTGQAAADVLTTCAASLTPVLVEAGGKDALLVDEDADVTAAAAAATWAGLFNSGQTCVGVERIYVHTAVYDEFVAALRRAASSVTAGPADPIGPLTVPSHVDHVRRHVTDAVERGAAVLVGEIPDDDARFVAPVVLTDVPADALIEREETFGPVLTVTRVRSMDEAIELTNAAPFGLGATVFSGNRGTEIAARLRCGMTSVNAVLSFLGMTTAPFGGVGLSGYGRMHGPEGLQEFSWPKVVTVAAGRPLLQLATFRRSRRAEAALRVMLRLRHGRAGRGEQ